MTTNTLVERDIGGGMPLPRLIAVTCFIAIAWHNVIGLNFIIWFIFKKWSGLYFWMVLITSWGIMFTQLGFLLMFFGYTTWGWAFSFVWCGWVPMVTGQSLVLYSRLHLVMRNGRKLRWILYMILTNAFIFHVGSAFLMVMSHNRASLAYAFHIWENFEVTVFGIQEVSISVLYIIETFKFLRSSADFRSGRPKGTMWNVLLANIFIIMLDLAVLCTQYANLFQVQVTFKGAVYSVKLIIEFFILNQLVDAVGLDSGSGRNGGYGSGKPRPKSTYDDQSPTGTVGLDTMKTVESQHKEAISATTSSVVAAVHSPPSLEGMDHIRVTKTLETKSSHRPGHAHSAGGNMTPMGGWLNTGRTSESSSEVEFAGRGS